MSDLNPSELNNISTMSETLLSLGSDPHATVSMVQLAVEEAERGPLLRGNGLDKLRGEWAFWTRAYEQAHEATSRVEVVKAIKFALGVQHLHYDPDHKLTQNMRSAALQLMCRRLMELKYGWNIHTRTIKCEIGVLSDECYAFYAQDEFRVAHDEAVALAV
jgi:hypothetical protein